MVLLFNPNLDAQDDPPVNEDYFDNLPVPTNMTEIRSMIGYPPLARENRIEGSVILRVLVDKAGLPVKYSLIKSTHPILTKAVTDKIMLLRFSPATFSGNNQNIWVTIPFTFKLVEVWPTYPDKYTITNTFAEPALNSDEKCEEEFLPHAIELTGLLHSMQENGLPPFTGKQRTLVCKLEISPEGTVDNIVVKNQLKDAFEDHVIGYLKTSKWTPGKACGNAVPSAVKLTLLFEK